MGDRWHHAATRLRQLEPPSDLWPRISEGPTMAPLPPPRHTRVVAAVTALAVFAAVGVLLWVSFGPLASDDGSLTGADLVGVPPRGEVAPVFLADGRPVFVVHHLDGTVSVVDAFSSHRAWGVEELNVWCPSTRAFVEVAHEARFDEYGRYASAGPAPSGLATFAFEPVDLDGRGEPLTIRVGAMRAPWPEGSAPEVDPSRPPFCPDGDPVGHRVPEAMILDSPAAAIEADPTGWVGVHGTLLVASDGFVQLCAEVDGKRCRDGAIVRGIDGVGLMVNVTRGPDVTGYEEPQLWLVRVRDGVLDDVAGLLGIQGVTS